MFRSLQLLLPALLPSWGFFDAIKPAPRIQYQLLDAQQRVVNDWTEFRPRPQQVGILPMLGRLFYNARCNETLYLMSCAERLMESPTAHSEHEILSHIIDDWSNGTLIGSNTARQYRFRLQFIHRDGQQLIKAITYTSPLADLPGHHS